MGDVTTLSLVELGVLGPLQVRQYGLPVAVPGAKPRAVLTMLGLHGGSVVTADALAELLWGPRPPRTAVKALQTHISSLRRALGDGYVLTEGTGWTLSTTEIDATRYKLAARQGRDAFAGGDAGQAVARFDEALALWRGAPELPDGPRGGSEKTRWIESHAALVEDRVDALLATGRAAEIVGELEAAIADAPLRERRWSQLMLALYRAGRQGEALAAYQRARSMLADELGVDPGPDLRRLEAAIVAQDVALEIAVPEQLSIVTRAVTFLLTDIEGSTAAWEADAEAMATALARHDEIVEQVVTSRGGRLVKTRGEGDATFSVFDRPSGAAAAAIELQEAIRHEPWVLAEPMRIRVALHTGEVELRDGDYFGRAVNRAARLRSLAAGGQTLCSGATAELVIDTLSDDVVLADLGMRQLRNLARPEHVFELRLETAVDSVEPAVETPIERPALPAVLAGPGPFVGRVPELEGLLAEWESTLAAGARAVLISGEPGVGKTRLAGEWSRLAYEQGAVVLYGRCDEDLGAAYQPFAEALRSLVPCLGADRLRAMRGIEALLLLVPRLTDTVPDLTTPTRSDPDTERYALFDAVVALLAMAAASAPVVLILDDLHWAAKPTLLLLRHLLRFGEHARVQIVGTYRSTDLDRSHPLAAMLADLHRDGSASRLALGGLDEDDVTAYVAEAGYDDVELARALASVTGGNPFFLIEALRHVAESGGRWDPSTLPQGVREAVSRRLSRLPAETNKALAAAAVVGSRFPLALVEQVVGEDLIDAFDEACKAGIVIEEPGGRYRFNHALVRQSLLAELASVRRMRLHQKIATTLEAESGADDELLAELAYHYFECAWAGNAAKAVEYCRRAADQAIERLAYEGAAELYDRALHALEELDDELPDRDALEAELLVARCEALLAAGDVGSAAGAVAQLRRAAGDSVRLSAWGTCFDGQLSMLTNPERLDEIESEVGAAAQRLAELDDAAGEANAHTVRAACLARLGRIADSETELDQALTAARRARDHRRVNAVLAGAPLAALWGPNPVPRAGGRCLDVVRLLRITTGSPVVEATSTRCQGVLDAMRGRAAAGRQLIDSARRTLTELGMRHALLEVDQFAGIVELVADDPAAAEPHLRRAYDGFRRMGLDADTAETAAFLARTCLVLDRDAEADELCRESERLAGHALRPSITWRTVRAQLHARAGAHDEARRVAGEAVSIAERTDALVDHGDACLTLAMVLAMAGDTVGSRAAAEQAVALFERKGAAALVERARQVLGRRVPATTPASQPSTVEPDNTCVRVLRRVDAALQRTAWDEFEHEYAPVGSIESRRKIVGFGPADYQPSEFASQARDFGGVMGAARLRRDVVAVRGERMALTRLVVGTTDTSPGAPQDEMLQLVGIDRTDRIVTQIWFDVDDIDAAITEMEAVHARFELEGAPLRGLENECVRVLNRVDAGVQNADWGEVEQRYAPRGSIESRRKIVGFDRVDYRPSEFASKTREFARGIRFGRFRRLILAVRGESLALSRVAVGTADASPGAPQDEWLQVVGIDADRRIALQVWFDVEDMDAAIAELDAQHKRLEQQPQSARLANAASRVDARFNTLFAGRRWDEVVSIWADDVTVEDRRRGLRREVNYDHASGLAEVQAIADLGVQMMTSTVIAVRGERLALSRTRYSGRDRRPEAFHTEVLRIIEINPEGRCVASIAFDVDDLDAAFAELDARYLAGEAAPHAQAWSVVVDSCSAINRQELPPATPDWVHIDHRPATPFASSDMMAILSNSRNVTPEFRSYIEAVHTLSDVGAVVTSRSVGISQDGFEAEWRVVLLQTVDGDLINRNEVFDEADLDAALARFDEISCPATRLENDAVRVGDRLRALFEARDWTALAELYADDVTGDDRRRVIGGGARTGRDTEIANMRAMAELNAPRIHATVIAVRGRRLALFQDRVVDGDELVEASFLGVFEINADNRIVGVVGFDDEDLDAAYEELDSRYIAGEAAANAHTWSVITRAYAAVNKHELPAWTPDTVNVDHRRTTAFAPGDLASYLHATWFQTPDVRVDIVAVHRLTSFGAVVTHVAKGTTEQGFEGEWREITLSIVEGDRISRSEMFDEADLDAALARFDELANPATRLENTASRVEARAQFLVAAGHWDAMAEVLADDVSIDDRRRVVNAGLRRGRDAVVEDLRVGAEIGLTHITPRAIAIRGERLTLGHIRYSGDEERPEVGVIDLVQIVEIDADERITALVLFDADNLGAAVEELESRYVSGEGAALARTWSVIAESCAALNRQELPERTPGFVYVDRRRVANMGAADVSDYFRAAWELTPDMTTLVESVYRLSDVGAVVSQVAQGTSHDGFYAEWRVVNLFTVDDGFTSRCEVFDETDVDAALARFDELTRQQQPHNAASRMMTRFQHVLHARDWDGMAEIFAEDICLYDRRPLVGVEFIGRDATIANMRASADTGVKNVTSTVVATRGSRLTLHRVLIGGRDERPEAFRTEALVIGQVDALDRLSAFVMFDLNDVDDALKELDARYLAGEAAAHAQTYSVIADAFVAVNRHELPTTTSADFVSLDHRRPIAFAPGEMMAYLQATLNDAPEIRIDIETVHRLSSHGVVVSHKWHNTSQQGFNAEWRVITISTVEDGRINRCELFDDTELDAALARFDELCSPAPQLRNTASRVAERFRATFAARDWDAMAEMLAQDFYNEDRRSVVNAGIRHGRDSLLQDMRSAADAGIPTLCSTDLATRGERLLLVRAESSYEAQPGAFYVENIAIAEIDADGSVTAQVVFDVDDLDAAFQELDKRYIAGEAAAHAHTWSVIKDGYAALNRHEIPPTTPDWVNIDHRRGGSAFPPGELATYVRSSWVDSPQNRIHVEAVHRLNDLGAVVTSTTRGVSVTGFYAEWREVGLVMVDGEKLNRTELFDETDLDAALAKFDELSSSRFLENAAGRILKRARACFAARDWDGMRATLAEEFTLDDRRRTVNGGMRHGGDSMIRDARTATDVGITGVAEEVIAVRGERLILTHTRYSECDDQTEAFFDEVLEVIEIDDAGNISMNIVFDPNDVDAAFAELDARYLAGEAAPYAQTWSAVAETHAAYNRNGLVPDDNWVSTDHRRGYPADQLNTTIRGARELTPDLSIYIESVHRLSDRAAVVTNRSVGSSHQGFVAEWRMTQLMTVDGDHVTRLEIFDETDLDAALARFDELTTRVPRIENATTRIWDRLADAFNRRDVDAFVDLTASDGHFADRRMGLRDSQGGAMRRRVVETLFEYPELWRLDVEHIAVRGSRLCLSRQTFRDFGDVDRPTCVEVLTLTESATDDLVHDFVLFDPDDIEPALAELDARYLAGEGAAHAQMWALVVDSYARFNRHEPPLTTPDWVNIDHRRVTAFEPGDLTNYVQAAFTVTPDTQAHIAAVHRLSNLGAVITASTYGTSPQGFRAEWRDIHLLTFEGDLGNRFELFDDEDLDAALARFDEINKPPPRPDNAAMRAWRRFSEVYNRRDLEGFLAVHDEDAYYDDRRKGLRDEGPVDPDVGRALLFEAAPSWRLSIELIATRGEALALMRGRFRDIDEPDGPSVVEVLAVVEVSDREMIAYEAFFDPDEIDSALAELDARFLAGVDAAHSHIWKLVNQTYARFNRHELSQTTTDWVNVDHRRAMVPAPGEMNEYVSAMWAVAPDVRTRIESVHRLTHLGAVFTHTESGTSREGFDAEWREITLLMFDGELISRCELFDDHDLDTALSWFDKLSVPATHLDNAAIRGDGRAADAFNRGDLEGYLGVLATNAQYDDRRRGLRNAGPINREFVRGLLFTGPSSWRVEIEPVANRGRHLALVRHICRDSGEAGKPVVAEVLAVVEAQDDERISRSVLFDLDEIAAAFQELDSQYLAGEAAQCRDTWSAVAQMYSGLNRHELPAWITDVVHLDYRTVVTIDPNDLAETLRTAWDLVPDLTMYVESIHRLTDVGAVVTNRSYGRSKEGFDAEWRMIQVLTVGRGRIDHFELFDEGDIDAALARLDELSSSATRLENAASRTRAQVCDTYNRRDVDGFLSLASGRYVDRRKGLQYEGAADGDYAAAVLSGTPTSWHLEHEAVAIRGDRLALSHETFRDTADAELPVTVELIALTDLTDKFVPCVVFFDPDDIHSAFAELTARWVASGEVEHPAVIQSAQRIFDMANRHDWAAIANRLGDATYVSHRQLGLDDADISGYLSSIQLWASLVPDLWVEAAEVFAHSAMGVLARLVLKGTSTEGAVVEVPAIYLILLDGDRVTHLETYDPQQRDRALARFEELNVTAPLSDNAVTRVLTGVVDYINRRDVDSYLSIFTDDARYEDRRKGLRDAGLVKPDFARAVIDGAGTGWQVEVECIANRGPHLVLCHLTYRDHDEADHPVVVEALFIAEITVSQLISTLLLFYPDDIDAALAELTARWIASGECGHPGVMEAIQTFAESANRHEWDKLATRHAGATYTNHLQLRGGADTVADDMSSLRMLTSLVPDLRFELTDVLRLSATGIVIHTVAKGTSTDDVPFDLPFVVLLLIDGHRIVHAETYDLDQREQALTRFDELTVDGPQPNNALARVLARVVDAFDRRDPDRYLALFSEDCTYEDRRKGLRDAGSIRPDYAQAVTFGAAAGWQAEFETIAVRGEHLMLGRATFRDQSEAGNPIAVEALNIGSINKDELIFWFAVLDPDDIDAAFAELTARWIASGEVAYPDVIEAALRSNEMYNRHDWDAIAANEFGATYVNHRQLVSAEPETIEDHWRSIRALAALIPDLRTEPVEILAHSAKGVVTDLVVKGRTPEGAVIEFPVITLILFDGTRVIHMEAFDVNQRGQALARFDELHGQYT